MTSGDGPGLPDAENCISFAAASVVAFVFFRGKESQGLVKAVANVEGPTIGARLIRRRRRRDLLCEQEPCPPDRQAASRRRIDFLQSASLVMEEGCALSPLGIATGRSRGVSTSS